MPAARKPRNARASAELAALRDRLEEAESTLDAIRAGQIDALVVNGPDGEQVFTLRGADHRYRLLVETMNEGAVTLDAAGNVLYCNARFAELLDTPLERVIGATLRAFVAPGARRTFDALVRKGAAIGGRARVELELLSARGVSVPVYLSVSSDTSSEPGGVSLIATDLTEQKRNEELLAAERVAASILEHAAEPWIVCDGARRVLRVSRAAGRIAARDPIGEAFDEAFPLRRADDRGPVGDVVEAALRGELSSGVEVVAERAGEAPRSLLLSAGPLLDAQSAPVGCVVSLTDITDRKHAEEERAQLLRREQRARERAEEANRTKDVFLATVSHELRTPLTAIMGWSRMLRTNSLPANKREHAIETIERNAVAQGQLIEDLLDISRIVSGKLRLTASAVDPRSIIEGAVDASRLAADAKGIRLEAHIEPGVGAVVGDPDRLLQIVSNLLTNAVKFTPRGGSVHAHLRAADESIEIVVEDDGQGIDPEFLPFVFDRFRQADGSVQRAHGGLGLGLAIVRHLVELHGGTIEAHSDGDGRGARFVLRLPVNSAAHDPSARASVPPAHGTPEPLEAATSLDGVRVLVVDDEPDARDLLVTMLARYGASAVATASAPDARAALARDGFDVLVSDIAMPGEDGYALIRSVRSGSLGAHADIPAAALTAYARTEDRTAALLAGFNMHVAKPIEPAHLVIVIAQLVGRAKKLQIAG